jgi:hypothetical protein
MQSQSDAGVVGVIVVVVVGFVFYLIPTGIAVLRNHPNGVPIFVVNLLLGWICIGWIVALVWSLTAMDESKHYR